MKKKRLKNRSSPSHISYKTLFPFGERVLFFWGCPALQGGSGCIAARKSARPCRLFASLQKPWVCRLRRPCCPSLSLRRLRRLLDAEHQMAEAIGQKLAPKEERPSDVQGGGEAADQGALRRRAEQTCEPRNVAPQA
ncbi:hypothetical protein SGRA_1816 [Saprospira grandis str. Lewin]|uniref:Uncharacterized protein n=1 Tax=Saprospira grandis (strain Lewin) TaxID=984262 RepID=H6L0L5_SAPGL|nr:hypothetical protein SGRA_1816 [Saprospira grandis str. Lewin]